MFLFAGHPHQGQQMRGGPPRGGRGNMRGHGQRGGRSSEPLKFDTDFDFETSNAQFEKEAIEKELKNLSLSESVALVVILFMHFISRIIEV